MMKDKALATDRSLATTGLDYQELIDFLKDGYLETDTAGIIQKANRAAVTLLRVNQNSLIGRSLLEFIAGGPMEREVFQNQLSHVMDREQTQNWDLMLQPHETAPFLIRLTVGVVHNADGNFIGLRWLLHFLTGPQKVKEVAQDNINQLDIAYRQAIISTRELTQQILVRKRTEAALAERLRFETLLTELSAAFANSLSEEVNQQISTWLQRLAIFLDVDRATFMQFREDRNLYRSHSYASLGVEPLPEAVAINEQFPWLSQQLSRGNTIKWTRIPEDLPEEAVQERQYSLRIGAKSGLNIPISIGSSITCVIAFTCLRAYRDWPDEFVARLRLVGEIFANASARLRARETMEAGRGRLQALFKSAPIAIFFTDNESRFLEANPTACTLLGYSLDELLQMSVWDLISGENLGLARELWQMFLATGAQNGEFPLRHKGGHMVEIEYRAVANIMPGLNIVIFHDIAQRKQVEQRLAYQAHLLDNVNDAIIATDENFMVTVWNRAAEKMYGWRVDEVIGRKVGEVIRSEFTDVKRLEVLEALTETGHYCLEVLQYRQDGQPIYVEGITIALRSKEGQITGYVSVNRDITARKAADEEIRRYATRMEALAEISRALTEVGLEVQAVLDTIVRHTAETIGDCCVITLMSNDEQWFKPVAFHHTSPDAKILLESVYTRSSLSSTNIVPASIRQSGQPLLIPIVHQEQMRQIIQPEHIPYLEQVGIHSVLIVPLRLQGRVVGTLGMTRDRPGYPYTLDDQTFLTGLADRAVLILQNAQLFEAEQQAHQMAQTLRAANLALTRTLNMDVVLETLLDYLGQLVPYDGACVMLLEAETRLVVYASRNHERWTNPSAIHRLTVDVSSYPHLDAVLTSQVSMLIPDTDEYPEWDFDLEIERVRNWLGIPLVAGGKVIGLYSVDKIEPNFFTQKHLRSAEALAAQAAVAIQNAMLFTRIRAGRQRLQMLSRRLVEVQEAERRYIARELHDEIGEILTGLKLILEMSIRLPADLARDKLSQAQNLVNDLMRRVEELSLDLRPAMLDDLGLLPALLWHLERYTLLTHVHVDFEHSGLERRFRPEVETAAYRIVQEALTNVARHAGVSEVAVRLWAGKNTLGLQVEDRGPGFDPDAVLATNLSSGLAGMQERVTLIEGQLIIESSVGRGTRLTAELPVEP